MDVVRVLTDAATGHALDPAAVPAEADLVVVGNPTNPTRVLHPADSLRALARRGGSCSSTRRSPTPSPVSRRPSPATRA